MTRQIRTWQEHDSTEGEPRRWNVLINGTPVPGGFVEETADGRFEIHYPRLQPKAFDSLDEAKRRIELAPPITKGALAIANPVESAEEELLSTDEAGALLGVSRYRINAMVANGVLAGKRSGGRTLVSRASVESRLSRMEPSGPVGRFAHTFICYYPNGSAETYRIIEIDPDQSEQIEAAREFLQAIVDAEGNAQADVLDYRQAMSLCARAKQAGIFESAKPISFREFQNEKAQLLEAANSTATLDATVSV